jgi:hypothetical protein
MSRKLRKNRFGEMKLMNAASYGILTVKDHLGDLRDTHWRGLQQNDLASRLDRGIGSSMVEFLDHLLLSGFQIAHVDFTWPGYGSTSLIVVLGLSFYNISRRGFTALCSVAQVRAADQTKDRSLTVQTRDITVVRPVFCRKRSCSSGLSV